MNLSENTWVKSLYIKHAPTMYRSALYRLNDPTVAEDLVHEAFLVLMVKLDKVRDHPNLGGWLMRTMQYLILQHIEADEKKLKREIALEDMLEQLQTPETAIPLKETFPPGLSEREENLLTWFYEQGLSYEEISQRLQIPILTCRTQMFRARQHMKKLMEQDEKIILNR